MRNARWHVHELLKAIVKWSFIICCVFDCLIVLEGCRGFQETPTYHTERFGHSSCRIKFATMSRKLNVRNSGMSYFSISGRTQTNSMWEAKKSLFRISYAIQDRFKQQIHFSRKTIGSPTPGQNGRQRKCKVPFFLYWPLVGGGGPSGYGPAVTATPWSDWPVGLGGKETHEHVRLCFLLAGSLVDLLWKEGGHG